MVVEGPSALPIHVRFAAQRTSPYEIQTVKVKHRRPHPHSLNRSLTNGNRTNNTMNITKEVDQNILALPSYGGDRFVDKMIILYNQGVTEAYDWPAPLEVI